MAEIKEPTEDPYRDFVIELKGKINNFVTVNQAVVSAFALVLAAGAYGNYLIGNLEANLQRNMDSNNTALVSKIDAEIAKLKLEFITQVSQQVSDSIAPIIEASAFDPSNWEDLDEKVTMISDYVDRSKVIGPVEFSRHWPGIKNMNEMEFPEVYGALTTGENLFVPMNMENIYVKSEDGEFVPIRTELPEKAEPQ